MKRTRFSEQQIITVLKEAGPGTKVAFRIDEAKARGHLDRVVA